MVHVAPHIVLLSFVGRGRLSSTPILLLRSVQLGCAAVLALWCLHNRLGAVVGKVARVATPEADVGSCSTA